MGSISVACYKPKPGCEEALLELVRNHLPPLREQGLVTDRASIMMRTGRRDHCRDIRVGLAGSHRGRAFESGCYRFVAAFWRGVFV